MSLKTKFSGKYLNFTWDEISGQFRILHIEKFRDVHRATDIVKTVKSKSLQ